MQLAGDPGVVGVEFTFGLFQGLQFGNQPFQFRRVGRRRFSLMIDGLDRLSVVLVHHMDGLAVTQTHPDRISHNGLLLLRWWWVAVENAHVMPAAPAPGGQQRDMVVADLGLAPDIGLTVVITLLGHAVGLVAGGHFRNLAGLDPVDGTALGDHQVRQQIRRLHHRRARHIPHRHRALRVSVIKPGVLIDHHRHTLQAAQ